VSCELGVSRGVFTKVQVQRMTNGLTNHESQNAQRHRQADRRTT